ncbi:PREDICTED: uncharacterized protein LOC100632476 [Amphimedon queenslandica]|uniref:CABIT domain-containing protein n=1 Tax=Amphimedon queenslandica TaxID=400682 RepID=A0AAN0IWB5_AMPQE|nr:PREDICTED: uncharacterized protein LOC100632476 [Amphimedon queenslandica]|eukprot:XP_019848723.1 PREDICTED: uncharacterized protein LOC100632476 [Amphimedon queenslandica]
MQPGRPLPQLPIERPLPELPYSSYDTLPPARPVSKTPPPSRRIAVEHDIDTPPPLPPVSALAMVKKSQSAFFNMDNKVQRPSLPDASVRPPLPPRKSSVPVSSYHNATTPPSKRESTSSSLSTDRSSMYDIPKSMKSGAGVGRGPSSVSLDSVSVCSFGRAPSPVNYVPVSESMSLKQLVAYHQNEFPLRVEVSAGYFGDSECDTFSEGDRLNFHFIKQLSVAVIETGTGQLVRVPLNSAARFSLIYDPNNNPKEAVTGFEFKSVKDVLAQKDMPKIICATKAHGNPSNVSHSVQAGELLLINEVKHGRFGGQSLICTSIENEKQKRLPENCQGFFSTAPNHVMLYLPELTKKFDLPLKVIVSELPSSGNLGGRISDSLTIREIVTIVSVNKESTIIATPVPDEEDTQFSNDNTSMMFDIPVDLEILEVQIIEEKNSDEFEKLYVDTRQLLDSFDPSKTDKQVRVGKQDDLYYTAIREDHKNVGIELLASESIYSEPRQVLARKKMENAVKEKLKSSVEQSSTSSSPLPQIIEPKCLPSDQVSVLPMHTHSQPHNCA